jgi:hypothetical protein
MDDRTATSTEEVIPQAHGTNASCATVLGSVDLIGAGLNPPAESQRANQPIIRVLGTVFDNCAVYFQ